MIVQINEQTSVEAYFDPLDREEGYDDDIRFVIHQEEALKVPELLAAGETGIMLTPTQAEQLATALWQAALKSRTMPWPGRPRKKPQSSGPFANAYPHITKYTKTQGWIELGQAENSSSLLRAMNPDGSLWESTPDHHTPDLALQALENRLGNKDPE